MPSSNRSNRYASPTGGDLVASRSLVKRLIDPVAWRVLDSSQPATGFYGDSRDELRHLSAWDLTPDRSREQTLAMLATIATGHQDRIDSVRPVTCQAQAGRGSSIDFICVFFAFMGGSVLFSGSFVFLRAWAAQSAFQGRS